MKYLPTLFLLTLTGCVSHDLDKPFDCSATNIVITLDTKSDVSSCAAADGSITISASMGQSPYLYSINGGEFSSNSVFSNLTTGSYTLTVKDANGCESTLVPSPTINSPGSTLSLAAVTGSDTNCLDDNGSISVTASGGVPPYTYRLNTGDFSSVTDFASLADGNYTVTAKDSEGCTFSVNASIARGDTGISWSNEIQIIINSNCAVPSCHNGGQSPNLSSLSVVQANKASIKTRTSSKSMPPSGQPSLSDEQIKKIACWVDDGGKDN